MQNYFICCSDRVVLGCEFPVQRGRHPAARPLGVQDGRHLPVQLHRIRQRVYDFPGNLDLANFYNCWKFKIFTLSWQQSFKNLSRELIFSTQLSAREATGNISCKTEYSIRHWKPVTYRYNSALPPADEFLCSELLSAAGAAGLPLLGDASFPVVQELGCRNLSRYRQ